MMEIAHRLALTTAQQTVGGGGFTVSLTGLTNNPTFGLCAERGTLLEALATGAPDNVSYQWYVAGQGAIAGATTSTFTPDETIAPEALIYCILIASGGIERSSPPAVVRAVPPALGSALFDEVFDLDTGLQIVATASAFTGLELRFSANGAGAVADPVTGDVSVPTDVAREGDVITVIASNSGGAVSSNFLITVENVAVGDALPFGALTPAGMGGVPVSGSTITQGDPGGHWKIVNGSLVPTAMGAGALAGVYSLVFNTGDIFDVMIEDDHASARPEEIEAVYNALPNTARGLMVHDGDVRGAGRLYLQPKAFLNEMVIEPLNWIEHADPRLSVRPVALAGITIGGSVDGLSATQNLTIQGFELQMEAGQLLPAAMQNAQGDATEGVRGAGIVMVENPSRFVTIRQNQIWSRTTADIVANDDYTDHWNTTRQMPGVTARRNSSYTSPSQLLRIEDNYIHDVEKGVVIAGCTDYLGDNSTIKRNYIMDTYTGFGTIGTCDGVDVFDNRGLGVFAASDLTDGKVSKSNPNDNGPHSGLFGFNNSGSLSTGNINFMGNIFGSSAKVREDLELVAGNSVVRAYGATGVKFNDPTAADAYFDLNIGFNTLITRGITIEVAGGTATSGKNINIFHNTLAGNPDPQGGESPLIYLVGAEKVRMWNNISCSYGLGALDGTSFYVETLDTLEGYGNHEINFTGDGGTASDFDEEDYFVGTDGSGALVGALIDEYETAYVPKAAMGAKLALLSSGALGAGLYAGDGSHTSPWNMPGPVGGVQDVAPITIWDGSAHFERSSALAGSSPGTYGSILMAWECEIDPVGGDMEMISVPGSDLYLRRESTGQLRLRCERSGFGEILAAETTFKVMPSDGMVYLMASYDMMSGRVQFVKNGVPDSMPNVGTLRRASGLDVDSGPFRLHADSSGGRKFVGRFGRAYFAFSNTFFDLETEAGLSAFYAADGTFRDWGPDGSWPTGSVPAVYIRGIASGLANLGTGGSFTLEGGTLSQ